MVNQCLAILMQTGPVIHSTSGNTFLLAGGAISWFSQKQQTIALSTCEAEYMDAAQEAIWLRH